MNEFSILASVSRMDNVLQFVGALVVFIIVMILVVVTTRFVGGFQKTKYQNNNLKVLETVRISNNQYLQIAQVGEVYLVLAVSKNNISLLTKLTKEELPDFKFPEDNSIGNGQFTTSFKDLFDKVKENSGFKKR